MSYGFVVLQSYIDAINELPEERRWPFFCELFDYRMNGAEIHPQKASERVAALLIMPVVDKSATRYDAAKKNGEKGGRPRKWIDQTEAEMLYSELGSWDKVADELDVDRKTLRRARVAWQRGKTGKNHDIDMDMDKDTDTDIFIHNIKENATAGRAQSASPRREPTREESLSVARRLMDTMPGRDEGGDKFKRDS
jgi:hypothetical protein